MADFTSGYFSLKQNVNKTQTDPDKRERMEGMVSELIPELSLKVSDDDLIKLKKQWEKDWEKDRSLLERRQKENEKYWLGKSYFDTSQEEKDKPIPDNLVFEAVETFIPLATRQNPEAMVLTDDTEQGQALADKVKKILSYQADRLAIKLSIKQATRYWLLYFLGCIKVGWNKIENDIDISVLRPQKLILDPNSEIFRGVYKGAFIGEIKEDKASTLAARYPGKKTEIEASCKGKMATKIHYKEWWTNEYVFWTLEDSVLDKAKNPHWNYETPRQVIDDFGNVTETIEKGNNHFSVPQMPYVFLNAFSLGRKPYDETNMLHQVLYLQDVAQRRFEQIDRNADSMNGGLAVSGDAFTKDQAAQLSEAVRKGGTVWVPRGRVEDAIQRLTAQSLPSDVYQNEIDIRRRVQDIFGITGSSAGGIQKERTVRGKVLQTSKDTDRIGGGVGENIEQFADRLYNWLVQIMYVYYDEPHAAAIIGQERAVEYINIKNSDFNRKITVSIKEGSLLPKDSMSKRNEAVELFSAGALDPVTLFDRLEFPNPRETAQRLIMWKLNPSALLQGAQPNIPGGSEPMPSQMAPQMAPPLETPQPPPEVLVPETQQLSQVPIQ